MTALYVLFGVAAAMDFAAYQCAGAKDGPYPSDCAATSWWLVGRGAPAHAPQQRVVIGALVPLLLIGLLWMLTHRSRKAYEEWGLAEEGESLGVDVPAEKGLSAGGFWTGQAYAARLAEIHIGVSLTLVALPLAITADRLTTSAFARPLTWVIVASALVGVVLAAVSRLRERLPQYLPSIVGLVLVGLSALVCWTGRDVGPRAAPIVLPGLGTTFDIVIGAIFLTGLALAVNGWLIQGRGVPVHTRLRLAFTPYTVVVLALVLTLTMLAGSVLWFARRLGEARAFSLVDEHPAIEYGQAYEVLARALPWIVIVLLIGGLLGGLITWLLAARLDEPAGQALAEVWQGLTGPVEWLDARHLPGWPHRLRRARLMPPASLAGLRWGMWTVALVITPLAYLYAALWLREMNRQGWPTGHILVGLDRFHSPLPLSWCSWLLTTLPVLAVLVLRQALTTQSVRRTLAIAWDISTFWPRSFHPLAPPSYAERAVPELQNRIRRLLGGQDGRPGSVLLLGHSQGSILVTAALASLTEGRDHPGDIDLHQRLGVITYGCPISRLYASSFPAYFNEPLVRGAAWKVHAERFQRRAGQGPQDADAGWWNAWRYTDYIAAGPVSEGTGVIRNEFLADPPAPWHPTGDGTPPIRTHSERGYRMQGPFVTRVERDVRRLHEGCLAATRQGRPSGDPSGAPGSVPSGGSGLLPTTAPAPSDEPLPMPGPAPQKTARSEIAGV
jgi:hypothetical protein